MAHINTSNFDTPTLVLHCHFTGVLPVEFANCLCTVRECDCTNWHAIATFESTGAVLKGDIFAPRYDTVFLCNRSPLSNGLCVLYNVQHQLPLGYRRLNRLCTRSSGSLYERNRIPLVFIETKRRLFRMSAIVQIRNYLR